ncbi:uncharacterized protein LOC143453306 [Clavelina lepadiformis]|uniref:uncharacterized protein LOC143453306 n=1 Tax=Clavelina lepadiformis TaxID=159417 RepID=UPI004042B452
MWFKTKESALQAIEDYQQFTLTRFIVEYNHHYKETRKRIRWDADSGIPYIITISTRLECQHGKDRNISKKRKRVEHNPHKKTYCCVQATKKKDCGAKIYIVEVLQFPQYQLKLPMSYQHRIYSRKIHQMLHIKNDDLLSIYMCKVEFPARGAHSGHVVQEIECNVRSYSQASDLYPVSSSFYTTTNGTLTTNVGCKSEIPKLLLQIQNITANMTSSDALDKVKTKLNTILNELQWNNMLLPEIGIAASEAVAQTADFCVHNRAENTRIVPNIIELNQPSQTALRLKNGPHSLSLLQILSLEPNLSLEETCFAQSLDPTFCKGCLNEEVINSYLWWLSNCDNKILYACSSSVNLMQNFQRTKQLWEGKSFRDKKYVFIPWNPDGLHWILLAVDVVKSALLYLDPLRMDLEESKEHVVTARNFVSRILLDKFGFILNFVESPIRTLQSNTVDCGMFVCMYANWLAHGEDLNQNISGTVCRKHIYDAVAGNCLQGIENAYKKSICKICNLAINGFWVDCVRCQQWYHTKCVGWPLSKAENVKHFHCP